MRKDTGPTVVTNLTQLQGATTTHGQFSLYQALREELGNLREYDSAGNVIHDVTDDTLARTLAYRLYQKHNYRKIF